MAVNPILVEVIRGDMVESFFRGAYVVMDTNGQVIDAVGNVEREIYPRSALKPVQAIGMIESGAAETFHLSLAEIALACASHNGEDYHVHLINKWLARLGLTCEVLECGIHASMDKETAFALARQGRDLTFAHNACSGKHTGFITQALHLGVPIENYTHIDHPVQQYVNRVIEDIIEIDIKEAPKGIDGCQVPVIGMPLKNLAQGMAKLAHSQSLGPVLSQAAQTMVVALQTHPGLIAGTGRFCSAITQESKGKIIAKMGADGVFAAILPEKGWGIALKIDDGHLKAAEVALMGVLKKHHLLSQDSAWDHWASPPVRTWNHQTVGEFSFIAKDLKK